MTIATLNLNSYKTSSILNQIHIEQNKIIPNIYLLKKQESENKYHQNIVNYQEVFQKTLIQYDNIKQDYEHIKTLWIKAIDLSAQSFKDFDAAFKAIDEVTIFFINNWKYFSLEERQNIYLTTQQIPRSNNFWSIIHQINFKRMYIYLKTLFKYRKDFFKPHSENRFIIFANKLDNFVKTVENLSKQDSINNNNFTINSVEKTWIDWEDQLQLNRIKKASQNFKRRREEEQKMTEDEIQNSREEFLLLEKIIAEYH